MRVLLLSSLYPPHVIGGAENSAYNLAEWLASHGVTVGVVRAAADDEEEGSETSSGGVRVWRVRTPHVYPTIKFVEAPRWKKPLWHLQDHFDWRIGPKVGRILDEFQPDLVNVHLIQGLGYPALLEVAKRKISLNYVLPDLGLACIRMNMFKNGQDCAGWCRLCKLSSAYKRWLISRQEKVSFVSPSRSNLDTLARYFPPAAQNSTAILNPNHYPRPTRARSASKTLRLLYAGRLHSSKGVDLLLSAIESLADRYKVSVKLAGSGPQEAALREAFGDRPWCEFLGFVSQAELANVMVESDLLCIPSIWAENSPGVVIQALGLGLPVLGSARGGIPELVVDGLNGGLVTDLTVKGWSDAIEKILRQPELLDSWRAGAAAGAAEFDQDHIGARILQWMREAAVVRSGERT